MFLLHLFTFTFSQLPQFGVSIFIAQFEITPFGLYVFNENLQPLKKTKNKTVTCIMQRKVLVLCALHADVLYSSI